MTVATWYVALILVLPLLFSIMALLLTTLTHTSLETLPWVASGTWLFAVIGLSLYLFLPTTKSLCDQKVALNQTIGKCELFIADGRRCIVSLDSRIEPLLVERRSIQETIEYRRLVIQQRAIEILTDPWQNAQGVEFERFLEKVFANLGGTITRTPITGDQGADLIVAFGHRRIAVQAKGGISTIGNGAVQEVLAGQLFYGCTESVVVTNSSFTRSAEELADRAKCNLIRGDEIEELALGMNRWFEPQIAW